MLLIYELVGSFYDSMYLILVSNHYFRQFIIQHQPAPKTPGENEGEFWMIMLVDRECISCFFGSI